MSLLPLVCRIAVMRCPKQRLLIPTALLRVAIEDAKVKVFSRTRIMTLSTHSVNPDPKSWQDLDPDPSDKEEERILIDEQRFVSNQIHDCETAQELLQLLEHDWEFTLLQKAGGGALSLKSLVTNFTRLGKFGAASMDNRNQILADPRFSLLLASVAEFFAEKDGQVLTPSTTYLPIMAWVIAKLKMAPSNTVLPSLTLPKDNGDMSKFEESPIATTCQEIRSKVLEHSNLRYHQSNQNHTESHSQQQPWLPITSKLAGYFLDEIAIRVISGAVDVHFGMRDYALLLWAWASASRVNTHAFHVIIDRIILQTQQKEKQRTLLPHVATVLWATATAEVYSPRLLNHVAQLFQSNPTLIDDFNTQDLSDTAWGVATMLLSATQRTNRQPDVSIGENDGTSSTEGATTSSLEIIRSITLAVPMRAAELNTKQLTDILWATATLGLGIHKRPQDSSPSHDVVLASNNPELDNHLMNQSVNALLEAAIPIINQFRSFELINILFALAVLIQPEQVHQSHLIQNALLSIGEQLCDKRNRPLTTQDIEKSLHSLTTLGLESEDMYRQLALRLTEEQYFINRQITKCNSAHELLNLLQNWKAILTQNAGGGVLGTVNLSTILHRLARFGSRANRDRERILADPQFALLFVSLGEALETSNIHSHSVLSFSVRDLSTTAWAIVKLKIAHSHAVQPSLSKVSDTSKDESTIAAMCREIRSKVSEYETVRYNQSKQNHTELYHPQPWYPMMSKLAGYILDEIAVLVVNHSSSETDDVQNYTNLLWSWAKASRVDTTAFHVVLDRMIDFQQQGLQIRDDAWTWKPLSPSMPQRSTDYRLQPQNLSNTLWAAATAQVYSPRYINHVAYLFQTQGSFIDDFKPLELSNSAWAVATIISNATQNKNRPPALGVGENDTTATTMDAQSSALEIMRWVLLGVQMRVAEYNAHDLAMILRAITTLGFGILEFPKGRSLDNCVVVPSDSPELDNQLMQQAVTALLEAAIPIIDKFDGNELSNILFALAILIQPEQVHQSPVIQKALLETAEHLCYRRNCPTLTTKDIEKSLWSLATIGYKGENVYRTIASRMTPEQVRRSKSQDLSNILLALTIADVKVDDQNRLNWDTLPPPQPPLPLAADTKIPRPLPVQRDPLTILFGAVAQELMRRPDDFTPQQMKDVVWSFTKQGIQHPSLVRFLARYRHVVATGADECGSRGS